MSSTGSEPAGGPPARGPGMGPPPATDSNFPANYRIGPTALTASIFTFLGVAIIIASTRLFLRYRRHRRLRLDDAFLIAAVILFIASCASTQAARNLLYIQIDINSGVSSPGPTFESDMMLYDQLNTAQSILQWATIYAVKFSYMLFFRNLISRHRFLEVWWWCVMAVLIPLAGVGIFLAFYVCAVFDSTFLQKCVLNNLIIVHESIFLDISTAFDITSDVLVISVPIALLCKVRLELQRKLALGAVLCLSVFMIVIACIRLGLCQIPAMEGTIPDTSWLFFWQSMEACVAIIMVSLTASRSLYGQQRSKKAQGRGYDYVNESSARRKAQRYLPKAISSKFSSSGQDSQHAVGKWHEGEELRAMDQAHLRDRAPPEPWDNPHSRETSRDKNRLNAEPESFV